ncbi:MAG: PAS domain-containing protein [Candidatus Cloacimonadota bacterium]|nr:MAG: PAS domain-containing protein [Candidatus Cloacimonadota bacterium]
MPPRRLIIVLRPIIATLVLGPEIYFRRNDPFSQVFPLVVIILISYFVSIIFYLILKTGRRGTVHDFVQTVSDTVIITGLVNFTGSINSPYTLLYFLNIVEGSLSLRPTGSFTITTIATTSFIVLGIVWMNRHLSPEVDTLTFNVEMVHYFLKVFIFILFFYLATALITYFKERFTAGSLALEDVLMTTDDILENINSGIITIDKSGKIKHFNPAAMTILSLDKKRVMGESYKEVFSSRLKKLSDLITNFSNEEKEQKRLEIADDDGGKMLVMVTISAMMRENIGYGGKLINIVDLTVEEEIQKRLRTADRMKTALELSAGIAHEIRNPLASVQGAIEVITREIKSNERVEKLVTLVLKETKRLNNIIERFLQFVRIPQRERKNADITLVLRDVVELIKNHPMYNKGIEINTEFPQEQYIVFIDPEQIKQVFLNILLNSFTAVEKEGKIEICFLKKDNYCGIAFNDNGIGIEKEYIDKIFQPFFSKTQRGSGLGLSVAHRIIEQHKGEITVESKKEKGSTFTVWLPLVNKHLPQSH